MTTEPTPMTKDPTIADPTATEQATTGSQINQFNDKFAQFTLSSCNVFHCFPVGITNIYMEQPFIPMIAIIGKKFLVATNHRLQLIKSSWLLSSTYSAAWLQFLFTFRGPR